MASSSGPPLDEIQWRSPALVAQLGGIHTNTILPYFSESPFFDRTSNNATLSNQALYNASMYHVIQTRAAFEARLRSMAGLEFMVVADPSHGDQVPTEQHSGVWVVRKQIRRKRVLGRMSGTGGYADGGVEEDEIEPIANYFVVGENVHMAPTVGGILESRLLSTASALSKLVSAASPLPIFNPALGQVYDLPKPKAATASSRQASKEGTPMFEAATASQTNALSQLPASTSFTTDRDRTHVALLSETITNHMRYGREYMDEHPLVGEPGSFIIQKSKEVSVPVGRDLTGTATGGMGAGAEQRGRLVPVPPPLKTDLSGDAGEQGKKGKGSAGGEGSAGGKKSPLSPTGTGKKRKKSKVQTPRTPKTPGLPGLGS